MIILLSMLINLFSIYVVQSHILNGKQELILKILFNRNINEKRRDAYKTAMRFIIQSIVLVVISCMMMGMDSYIDRLYAFHQNYPEFDTEEEVKEIYEVLKNAPNFESKLMQIENMTDLINAGCSMNMVMSVEPSESDTAKSMLEICDNEVIAMNMECDEHYDLMNYCKDKDNFMMDYITERNLNENLSGGVASISPN